MEKPVDRIRGILVLGIVNCLPVVLCPPAFLCSFDWFCCIQIFVMKHGFVDQLAQDGCPWLPLAAFGLKPSVRLRADIDYDFRHVDAVLCSGSVP
jgi:hypothetical protein